MATKKKTVKVRSEKDDARRGSARFVDQPGQWKDTTPASVKKKRDAELKKLRSEMAKGKKK